MSHPTEVAAPEQVVETDAPKKLTYLEAFFHVVKGCVGTGILALPESLMFSGLIGGTVIIFITGMLIIHCATMIVRFKQVMCKSLQVPHLPYSETMRYAVKNGPMFSRRAAKISPGFVHFGILGFQLGTCYVYVLFVGSNLKQIADKYIIVWDVRVWTVVLLIPMLLLNIPRNLKVLAPISQIANVVMFVGLGIIMYFVFTDLPGFDKAELKETPLTYARSFAMTLFAFGVIPVALLVERDMKQPERFVGLFGAFTVAITLITLLYMFVAFFGYHKYGPKTLSSISLNIPQDSVLAHIIRGAYVVVIFLSYPLQFILPFEILWREYISPKIKNPNLTREYIFKFSLIIGTFALAIALPLLGVFIALIGAVFLTLLSFIYPVIIQMCHFWPDNFGPLKIILWKDLLIFLLGVVVLIAATIICTANIISELQS